MDGSTDIWSDNNKNGADKKSIYIVIYNDVTANWLGLIACILGLYSLDILAILSSMPRWSGKHKFYLFIFLLVGLK